MRKKNYEEIKNYIEIESNSGAILNTKKEDYIDTHQLLDLTCTCGNSFNTDFHRIISKNKLHCNKCSVKISATKQRKDGQIVFDEFKNSGLMPQFHSEDYINAKEKLPYICSVKPEMGVQYLNYDNFKQGRRCGCCRYDKASEKQRLDGNIVYDLFVNKNMIPKFQPFEYKNANTNLPFLCPKHNQEIQYITYSNLIGAIFVCKYCVAEDVGDRKRIDGKIVYQSFIERGFTPLFKPEDYIKNTQKLPCICNKHSEFGVFYTEYADVRLGKGCIECGKDKISGENHYLWKGGISPIHNYFRDRINQWKRDSLEYNNFCCSITGINSNDLVVHHLYSYSKILDETLGELNLPIYDVINKYSNYELVQIENLLIKKHYEYGLGVPLISSIHNLYHSVISKFETKPEQFEEFKQRLKLGEFDDFLGQNNLKLII